MTSSASKPHSSGEMWGLWKLRRYGGNAVLGEREANELVDAYDGLVEQLEAAQEALREYRKIHLQVGPETQRLVGLLVKAGVLIEEDPR